MRISCRWHPSSLLHCCVLSRDPGWGFCFAMSGVLDWHQSVLGDWGCDWLELFAVVEKGCSLHRMLGSHRLDGYS
ncbi:hypothetical protein BO70DRAFT_149998 [Aspergillus heteromorphus CBS 117.55]|uniref:Uncharacterized protein n=1 Tax=Aspergillus heteromorphus CBS 117.55 TaxID=1448321 RepID=A0A317V7U5_9EURO|nr:uncharacterized protein BO70DRAFT_149998 [Aspergillus heteromorphus CBS 117.55]PWY69118.1 hypothetical protein BO70DRAFT_149998 [Aspergillus heteromorphus CBS 117.55]